MTVQEYVMDFLPKRFGVHPAYKKVLELIWLSEECDDETFANENFDNPRERAALAMPYQVKPEYLEERKRILDFLELLILIHRQEKHNEDWNDRIILLQGTTVLKQEEIDILNNPEGFWSG